MTPEERKLYHAIDDILWFNWDPIGINNIGVRDEYSNYVPQIYQLKISGFSKSEIATYLDRIVTEKMGMDSNPEFSEEIAEKIFALQ
jgi:hypothetical protein